MAILGPIIVGLLDAIGPMPFGCTNSPPLSFQSTLSDIFICFKASFFQFFLESCNPMVVLAIVCVAPAHPAATMQWARLWGHVGAHNEFSPKGCQNSTSCRRRTASRPSGRCLKTATRRQLCAVLTQVNLSMPSLHPLPYF